MRLQKQYNTASPFPDYSALIHWLKTRALELGFQQAGISDIHPPRAEARLHEWLQNDRHGEMEFMVRHGLKRSRPEDLVPGTLRVFSVRMDYLPESMEAMRAALELPECAYISRYTLGRDYHKLLRKRLSTLCSELQARVPHVHCRVFCDSAPVLEKPLAQEAGLGWIGKHTNLIQRHAGSWFFLGEIYLDLPLPVDKPASGHCGTCRACLDICPTQAIVAPYRLDARRCISYLTIELHGPIPLEFRPLLGNRVYGCDDCQLVCPWNRFARVTEETGFLPRHGLDRARLTDLFAWDEAGFLRRSEGSALRRLGWERWLRNLAVALGNAPPSVDTIAALQGRLSHPSDLVREHVQWALRAALVTNPSGERFIPRRGCVNSPGLRRRRYPG